MSDGLAPGPWLRACAVFAALATGVAAASGPLGLTHRALVGIALPPLVAVAVAAWQSHPRLRLASYAAVAALRRRERDVVADAAPRRRSPPPPSPPRW